MLILSVLRQIAMNHFMGPLNVILSAMNALYTAQRVHRGDAVLAVIQKKQPNCSSAL